MNDLAVFHSASSWATRGWVQAHRVGIRTRRAQTRPRTGGHGIHMHISSRSGPHQPHWGHSMAGHLHASKEMNREAFCFLPNIC